MPPSSPGVIELLGGPETFGAPGGQIDLAAEIRAGLPRGAVERLSDRLGLPVDRLRTALEIGTAPPSGSRPLSRGQSDRLARFARVAEHAVSVFDSGEQAGRWLEDVCPALDGTRPLDLFGTDAGAEEVDEVLGRIEYGLFS